MDPKVEEAIHFIHSYAPEILEWSVLKKELLKTLSPDKRRLFSTRDPSTKKINFNEFEQKVIEHWKEIAGIQLYLGKYEKKK